MSALAYADDPTVIIGDQSEIDVLKHHLARYERSIMNQKKNMDLSRTRQLLIPRLRRKGKSSVSG